VPAEPVLQEIHQRYIFLANEAMFRNLPESRKFSSAQMPAADKGSLFHDLHCSWLWLMGL